MYLLLRDNKQSGPYSLDELKAKGLKAYDLVWVEGRSAAWRYPSEIDELSAFAPAVEEQPFDRFYKKPVAATATVAKPTDKMVGTTGTIETNTATVTVTQPATSSNPATKRRIYVTMPGGIAARETGREPAPIPAREPVPAKEPAPIREIAPAREVLRETTSMREVVRGIAKPKRFWLPVGIGAAVLVLLTAGIFIGLSIHKDAPGFQKLASRTSRDNEQPLVRTTAQPLPVSPVNDPAAGNSRTAQMTATPTNANATETDRLAAKPRVTIPRQKAEVPNVQKKDAGQAAIQAAITDSLAVQPDVLHRETVHRTDALQNQPVDDRERLRVALANQVSVGTNKYAVGTFGGIHNLQITVTNRSTYSLDLVVVAVSYIQANKKTYKTENLYFRGIGPGMALMLEAPKSSRGINVEYKITSIDSKALGLSEPGT
jgi:hypothetical protein